MVQRCRETEGRKEDGYSLRERVRSSKDIFVCVGRSFSLTDRQEDFVSR